MKINLDKNNNIIKYISVGFITFVSLLVMFAWSFGIEEILSVIPGNATMKFNTALLFLLTAFGILVFDNHRFIFKISYSILVLIILLISFITLLEHYVLLPIDLDNLFCKIFIPKKIQAECPLELLFVFSSLV